MSGIFKAGNTAVITGGASGIGLSLVKRCVEHGMKVLVVDLNSENLAAAPKYAGGPVATFQMDVSKADDWSKLKNKVTEEFNNKITLLVLNAGVGHKSSWDDVSSFHKVLDTNLYGVINGIATLQPLMVQHTTPSAIVITGSKQGITNPPGNPAYNASKAAVKSLAEHLSYDLKETKVAVHLLVPGWTFTGIGGGGGGPGSINEKPAGAWAPEQVVDFLERKIGEDRFYIICPDNDVTEDMDRKRMLWAAGDVVEGRPPLTRWRNEWKGKAQEWMDKQA